MDFLKFSNIQVAALTIFVFEGKRFVAKKRRIKPRPVSAQPVTIVQGYSIQHPPRLGQRNAVSKPSVDIRTMERLVLPWDLDLSRRT